MAEVVNSEYTIGLSNREVEALVSLMDAQESLNPALVDLNNTLQAL